MAQQAYGVQGSCRGGAKRERRLQVGHLRRTDVHAALQWAEAETARALRSVSAMQAAERIEGFLSALRSPLLSARF